MRWALIVLAAACAPAKARPGPPDAKPAPSFARDIAPVLEHDCAHEKRCHGAEPTDDVDMDLRPSAAYAQLVGKAAEQRDGAMRVKPFDADGSFIIDKLTGRLSGHDGKQMPIDPVTGNHVEPSPLPLGFVDDLLIPWIAAGAKNN
jgi:hypothetical protein